MLDDGTNTYTYGLDRISQQHGSTAEYFLGDALASVRQLVDMSDAVTLSKSYDPYGNVIASTGSGTSIFAYTGEEGDQSGLTYLRARYYASYLNQFIQPDSILPDLYQPADWNKYTYTLDNPINGTDPSGYITENESKRAELILEKLSSIYDVDIKKDWGYRLVPVESSSLPPYIVTGYLYGCEWEKGNWRSLHELELTRDAIKTTARAFGGTGKFLTAMKHYPIHISRYPKPPPLQNWAALTMDPVFGGFAFGDILIFNGLYNSGDNFATQATIHELGNKCINIVVKH